MRHRRERSRTTGRLTQRGFRRFEVMAPESGRELIHSLARRLAEDGPEAEQARQAVKALVAGEPPKPGGAAFSESRAARRKMPLKAWFAGPEGPHKRCSRGVFSSSMTRLD